MFRHQCRLKRLPLPRLASVTLILRLLLGTNTPWKRVRLTLGLDANEAGFAIKSNGLNMTGMDALMAQVGMRRSDHVVRAIGVRYFALGVLLS